MDPPSDRQTQATRFWHSRLPFPQLAWALPDHNLVLERTGWVVMVLQGHQIHRNEAFASVVVASVDQEGALVLHTAAADWEGGHCIAVDGLGWKHCCCHFHYHRVHHGACQLHRPWL
jgi:hypothetical protein